MISCQAEARVPTAEEWQQVCACLDAVEFATLGEAYQESQSRLQAVIESLPFDFFLLADDGHYKLQNAVCREHGGDIIGRRPVEVAPDAEVLAVWEENNRRAFAGETVRGEERYSFEGETRWVYNIISPVRDGGRIRGIIGINVDITNEKRLADEVQRNQRLESLGVLAGGIAHDFNNYLMAIQGSVDLAMRKLGEGEPRQLLERAQQGCVRAQGLSKRLLALAKAGELERQSTALGPLLEEALDMLPRTGHCQYVHDIPDGLWHAEVDPGQIIQVVSNLVINAEQAMVAGGRVRVAAANIEAAEAAALGLGRRRHVSFTVSDEGKGISEEDLPRLFDPYFSRRQQGHGLGLTIVFSTVENHGGVVRVSSSSSGASFHVYLPVDGAAK